MQDIQHHAPFSINLPVVYVLFFTDSDAVISTRNPSGISDNLFWFYYGWKESVDPGILSAILPTSGHPATSRSYLSIKNCVGLAMNKNRPYNGENPPHFLTIFKLWGIILYIGQSPQIIVLIYPFSSTGAGDIYTPNCPDTNFKGFLNTRVFPLSCTFWLIEKLCGIPCTG